MDGDDAVLLLKLLQKYPSTLFLCTKDLTGNHPQTININYAKWKTEQNNSMCFKGFRNNSLAKKGFYD